VTSQQEQPFSFRSIALPALLPTLLFSIDVIGGG